MKAIVNIFLKNGILDSQGKAVRHALFSHGFESVQDVRVGKQIIIEMDENDVAVAHERVAHMCEELLANMVMEEYTIEIVA
jgi:phosphoribosylformylglycinamidine synthase